MIRSTALRILSSLFQAIYIIKQILVGSKPIILFISFYGEQISGDPKAFYEDLLESGKLNNLKSIWVNNLNLPIKQSNNEVLSICRKSLRYIYYFSNASIIINNCNENPSIKKHPKCKYIQTFHGSPFKKIGLDIEDPRFNKMKNKIRKETSMWTIFISPNKFFTKFYVSAFDLRDEQIFENILPRNFRLIHKDQKTELDLGKSGLEFDNKILYAPTFRDGYNYMPELDFLSSDIIKKNPETLFLIRSHSNLTRDNAISKPQEDYFNVIYPQNEYDMHDLFLEVDLLITDYSSSLFDFALLGKPIILFVPDIEEYKNTIRGLYFDIEDLKLEIAHTIEELSKKIKEFQVASSDNNYNAIDFNNRFNHSRALPPHKILDYLYSKQQ